MHTYFRCIIRDCRRAQLLLPFMAIIYGCAGGPSRYAAESHEIVPAIGRSNEVETSQGKSAITAFVGATVIPMDSERILENYTVLIQNGKIVELAPTAKVRVPPGAVIVKAKGQYIIPGLAEMHGHLGATLHGETLTGASASGMMFVTDTLRARRRLALWLANGVTTVRNLDHDFPYFGSLALLLRSEAGTVPSPNIVTAGAWIQFSRDWPSLDKVDSTIKAFKLAGYDFIKPYHESAVMYDSVVAAAKRNGLDLAGHVPQEVSLWTALRTLKSIEHPMPEWDKSVDMNNPDPVRLRALADTMRRTGIWHCPTQYHYVSLHNYPAGNGVLKALHQAGVGILLGTDHAPRQGIMAEELAALVAEGLTPYEALQTGTVNVARYFNTTATSGTIAVGKRADLVLLPKNPLLDVRATAVPIGVMVGGRWFTKDVIDRRITELADK